MKWLKSLRRTVRRAREEVARKLANAASDGYCPKCRHSLNTYFLKRYIPGDGMSYRLMCKVHGLIWYEGPGSINRCFEKRYLKGLMPSPELLKAARKVGRKTYELSPMGHRYEGMLIPVDIRT